MPHWEGQVCSEGKAMSTEKRQIDLDYAYTLSRVNTNLCSLGTLFLLIPAVEAINLGYSKER